MATINIDNITFSVNLEFTECSENFRYNWEQLMENKNKDEAATGFEIMIKNFSTKGKCRIKHYISQGLVVENILQDYMFYNGLTYMALLIGDLKFALLLYLKTDELSYNAIEWFKEYTSKGGKMGCRQGRQEDFDNTVWSREWMHEIASDRFATKGSQAYMHGLSVVLQAKKDLKEYLTEILFFRRMFPISEHTALRSCLGFTTIADDLPRILELVENITLELATSYDKNNTVYIVPRPVVVPPVVTPPVTQKRKRKGKRGGKKKRGGRGRKKKS